MINESVLRTFGLWNCDRRCRPEVLALMQWVNANANMRWQFKLFEESDGSELEKLDLLIVFERPDNFNASAALKYARALLFVGGQPVKPHAHVPNTELKSRWLVAKALDQIVQLISSPSNAVAAGVRLPAHRPAQTRFKLKRWPPSKLMRSPHYVKLAAMLTGSAFTISELTKKSGLPHHICESFIEALEVNQILTDTQFGFEPALMPTPPKSTARLVKPGLFGMIRQRLGL